MQWIAGYQETLGEFGVEEGDVLFPSHPQAGMGLLIDKYVDRTVATLSSWLVNIVEVGAWNCLLGWFGARWETRCCNDGQLGGSICCKQRWQT
jgi:hypothetical protein